jgi:hypothetical protein
MWQASLFSHPPHTRSLNNQDIEGSSSDPTRMGRGLKTNRNVEFSEPTYDWDEASGVVHVDRHILDNLKLNQEQNENNQGNQANKQPVITPEYANSIISKWRQQPPFPDPTAAGSAASTFRFHYNPGNGKPLLANELEQYNQKMKEKISELTQQNQAAKKQIMSQKAGNQTKSENVVKEKLQENVQINGQISSLRPQTRVTANTREAHVQTDPLPSAAPLSAPVSSTVNVSSVLPQSFISYSRTSAPSSITVIHPVTASALYGTNREAQLIAAFRDPRNTRTIQAGRPWLPTQEQVKKAKKKTQKQKPTIKVTRPQSTREYNSLADYNSSQLPGESDSELEFSESEATEEAPEIPESAWISPLHINRPVIPALSMEIPPTPHTRPQTSYAPQRDFLQVNSARSGFDSGAQTPIAPTRPATARYRESITSPASRTQRASQSSQYSRPSTARGVSSGWSIASPRSAATTTLGQTPEASATPRPSSAALEARHEAWISFSPSHDTRGGTLFDFDRRLENSQITRRETERIADQDKFAVLALH